jgi:hypothetical protein
MNGAELPSLLSFPTMSLFSRGREAPMISISLYEVRFKRFEGEWIFKLWNGEIIAEISREVRARCRAGLGEMWIWVEDVDGDVDLRCFNDVERLRSVD